MTPEPMKWQDATEDEKKGFSDNSWPLLDDLIERERPAAPTGAHKDPAMALSALIDAAFT